MARHRFSTPQTTSRNLAVIEQISIYPSTPMVEFTVIFGDDTSGTFIEERRETFNLVAPLPAQVLTAINTFTTRAFAFLRAQGIIPSGTEEP